MSLLRHPKEPSSQPSDSSEESGFTVPVERVIDHCWLFINGVRRAGECRYSTALDVLEELTSSEDQGFVWLSLNEPTQQQMRKVASAFGIHSLIEEDVVTAHQRPKVERYDDQLFMVVRSVRYSDFEIFQKSVALSRQVIETGEVQIVTGPNFVITIRHNTPFPDVKSRLSDEAALATNGPMSVTWALADVLVDDYIAISRELADDVDFLEEEVFTPGVNINIDRIYLLKREILEMRHAIDPLDPALRMMINDHKDLIKKQLRSYLRDVLDHEILVKDDIASFDERLTALISAAVAKVSIQQNADMRTISAYVGMAAVPTLVAGIYGMNFDNMPELHYKYSYYAVLLLIAGIVALMWWWFRKQNWL